ncbi:MAG: aldo/keto reductase [Bacteriovoracaceae bacterium]|nr:aldo/keto reductase [Bacteriovoracaceae bacterium]
MKNKLILGTVQLGLPHYGINNLEGRPSLEKSLEILDYAWDHDIRCLDTAEAYGESYDLIRTFHERNNHKKFSILTKFHIMNKEIVSLEERLVKTLNILRVNSLECFSFHSSDDYFKSEDLSALHTVKQKGLLKNIGVSLYTNNDLEVAINRNDIDIIQIPFNLLDNMSQRRELLQKAHKQGIKIHARSIFLQGLFLKPPHKFSQQLRPLISYLEKIKKTADQHQISIAHLSMTYVLGQDLIDGVLFGIDNLEQLQQNLKVAQQKMNNEILSAIDNIKVKEIELLNPVNWN